MRSPGCWGSFASFRGGKETVLLFAIRLLLVERPVSLFEGIDAKVGSDDFCPRLIQHALELWRKTVAR
jgi:hypothetical protein